MQAADYEVDSETEIEFLRDVRIETPPLFQKIAVTLPASTASDPVTPREKSIVCEQHGVDTMSNSVSAVSSGCCSPLVSSDISDASESDIFHFESDDLSPPPPLSRPDIPVLRLIAVLRLHQQRLDVASRQASAFPAASPRPSLGRRSGSAIVDPRRLEQNAPASCCAAPMQRVQSCSNECLWRAIPPRPLILQKQ